MLRANVHQRLQYHRVLRLVHLGHACARIAHFFVVRLDDCLKQKLHLRHVVHVRFAVKLADEKLVLYRVHAVRVDGLVVIVFVVQYEGGFGGVIMLTGIMVGWANYLYVLGDIVGWNFQNDQVNSVLKQHRVRSAYNVPQIRIINCAIVVT